MIANLRIIDLAKPKLRKKLMTVCNYIWLLKLYLHTLKWAMRNLQAKPFKYKCNIKINQVLLITQVLSIDISC